MRSTIISGNAIVDGADHKGWFIGHLIENSGDLRFSEAVEVKWGVHRAGESKSSWSENNEATTLSLLIRGAFRIIFPDNEFLLSREGDYLLWSPGFSHTWLAKEDSVILTVRWPSKPGDSIPEP